MLPWHGTCAETRHRRGGYVGYASGLRAPLHICTAMHTHVSGRYLLTSTRLWFHMGEEENRGAALIVAIYLHSQ